MGAPDTRADEHADRRAYIEETVAAAPLLTPGQRVRIAALLHRRHREPENKSDPLAGTPSGSQSTPETL